MCQADKEIKHEYFGEPIFSCSKNLLSELYREERLGEKFRRKLCFVRRRKVIFRPR